MKYQAEEQAKQALQEACERFPTEYPWGLASCCRRWYREFKQAEVVDSFPVTNEIEKFASDLQAYGL